MKRVLSVLLALCLLLGAVPMFASAEATVLDSGDLGNGITWKVDSNYVVTVSGEGAIPNFPDGDLPNGRPNSILGRIDYSKLPDAAGQFAGLEMQVIKGIVVEEGITDIGNNAFRSKSMPYPRDLTVSLPSTLKHIGPGAFYYCEGLKQVEIPAGVTTIGQYAFYGTKLESVTIPGSVRNVEEYSFSHCFLLESVTLEEGVKEIENWAFLADTHLTTVDIPHSIQIIGAKAFGRYNQYNNEDLTDINYNGTQDSWKYIQTYILNDYPECKTFMDDLTNATVHYQGGDIEPDPSTEPEPEGEQLYFYFGVHGEWDEELGFDIVSTAAGGVYDSVWGNALPIYKNNYCTFFIETEDGDQGILVKDLVASEGLILEEIPEEQFSDDEQTREHLGGIARVTTTEYDKVYTITYTDDAGTVYTATLDSHAYGANWYSEPELDNANIVSEVTYDSMDEQPSAYLGIKMDPNWEGTRRVASVNLDPYDQHSKDFTMEKVNDTLWKFTLKREAMTGFPRYLGVQIQWEQQDENGSWVPDEYPERPYIGFNYDPGEPMPEGEQLYVCHGVSEMGWNDELDAPIYGYDPGPNYDEGMRILPGQQGTLFFAIKTGETSYQDIPISELTVPAGVHLTAIPEEQLEEDSKNLAGCAAFMTVDDFDKGYTITYTDDNGELYALRLNSSTYGALFYTKPEFKNEYIVPEWQGYNIVGDQPVIYLGIKDEPLSHRRVKTIKMNDESLENYTFEKVNDSFWKITLKKESMGKFNEKSGSFNYRARIEIQWEHEEGEGNWVQDDWLDTPETGFWPECAVAYATSDLVGKEEYVTLESVKDKLSSTLEMTVGETKTIYTYIVQDVTPDDNPSFDKPTWIVAPVRDQYISALKAGIVTLSDITGKNTIDVTAEKAGTTELAHCFSFVSVLDKDGKELPDEIDWVPLFAEYFNIPESEVGYTEEDGIPWWTDVVDGKLSLVFEDTNGVEHAYPNIAVKRLSECPVDWPENNITVTVKEKPQPKPPVTPSFTDVPAGQYYTDAVAWAVAEGITNGMTKNTFVPGNNCTRAQIVTFIWRALDKPATDKKSTFTDMPTKPADFVNAINWAVAEGVTKGKGKGTFLPDATCTRAEAVTFIWRALGKPTVPITTKFTDMPSDSDFQKAISWAVANGVTKGKTSTTFVPNGTCTRGEIVTFLHRAMA